MPKKRIQSPSRSTLGNAGIEKSLALNIPSKRFIGVSLSGGKADKACVAVLEYYPSQKKVFLAKLVEKIKAEEFISADLKIHEVIMQYQDNAESVAFDVPLTFPFCVHCELPCPGYETCNVENIKFIRKLYQNNTSKRKPKKMYTPYTQRSVDAWLAHKEPSLDIQDALSANLAPLTARAHFIRRRLPIPCVEVFAKLSVLRLGRQLKINPTHLQSYRNSVGGAAAREIFLNTMIEKLGVFFYRSDIKIMIENFHAFEAFIAGYSALLLSSGQCESRPANLPKNEGWIAIPN